MKVEKRDGMIVDFDLNKIENAITKANENSPLSKKDKISKKEIKEIVKDIFDILNDQNIMKNKYTHDKESGDIVIKIEDIQDTVENILFKRNHFQLCIEYDRYRKERDRIRNKNSDLMNVIREKLSAKNVQNQNANVDERSFGGRKGEADSELLRQIALDDRMSEMAKNNYLTNEIYTHDLDSYELGQHNCLSIPFDDLLSKGFKTRQTDVRPANSINTAFQLIAVCFQIQSLQQFGGCSATHLDWTMVPYVKKSFNKHYRTVSEILWDPIALFRKNNDSSSFKNINIPDTESIDSVKYKGKWFNFIKRYKWLKAYKLTLKELNQAVEGLYHNLNTLQSRSGNQLPFTSINYGTCTSTEGRMVIRALLNGCINGVGAHHKTAVFPCGIFQYMKGVNDVKGTPNYDLKKLAIKSTTLRLYPNYANVDWSGNEGYDVNDPRTYFSTMGCRTANGFDINGFGQLKDGRGNICPVTIVMPTVAMRAKNDLKEGESIIDAFFERLDLKIHEAKDQLIERFNWICSQSPSSADFMWENGTMAGYDPKEGLISAMKHGTLAIGQLGLAETLQILINKDHTSDEGMELAKRIEGLFKKRCSTFKQEYKLNFGVYYTPAENLAYTAMTKFKKEFGAIPNVSDRDYFTNSMHVPVWHKMSPFEKIDIESQLTSYSSAGCITYIELDDNAKHNEAAVEQIVDYAMKKDIPYFAINVPNDVCETCGYIGEVPEGSKCPKCGGVDFKRLRRVTGYLTNDYHLFNYGKQMETKDRVKHSNSLNSWNK